MIVKFKTSDTKGLLAKFTKLWLELAPQEPFSYFFTDERFENNYRREINVARILNILTAIAIFLCCLGLFGLALFVVNNRTKEIGIRKTNGATVSQVLGSINNPFIIWITIAYLIACPIAYFLVQNWLKAFAYKTEISPWIFIFAAFITVLVTFITVSFHSWRAATRNPVEALRYE
jgi:putative ABC transport system permease protein